MGIRIKILILMVLAPLTLLAQFSWPLSNSGPYTLAQTINNTTVFTPNGQPPNESDPLTFRYHLATVMARASNAVFLAIAASTIEEGQEGQQCHLFSSLDRGITWSGPVVIVPEQSAYSTNQVSDGSRYARPRNASYYNGTNYLTFAVDQQTTNGILAIALLSCALSPDGTAGTLFRISTNSYNPTNGYPVPQYDPILGPPLLSDSILVGKWGGNWNNTPEAPWIGFWYNGFDSFTEPSTVSADGSTNNYYRFWRVWAAFSGTVSYTNLAFQFSTNGGSTWSGATNTAIPNEPSETVVLRLNDGRFAFIGNPDKYDPNGVSLQRDPLFLAITEPNGGNVTNVTAIRQNMGFYPIYFGNSKFGGAQYPGAIQVGNYLYVGYSVHKEWVGFSRVLIPGLPDNNNDGYVPLVNISVSTATVGTLRTAP